MCSCLCVYVCIWSGVIQSDLEPTIVGDGSISSVISFRYLAEYHAGMQLELNTRISHAASAFGALKNCFY